MFGLDLLLFLIIFFLCLCSVIGYGFFFHILVLSKRDIQDNLKYVGFYGIGLITFISMITSIFLSHNYLHNIIIHFFGFLLFLLFFKKNLIYFKNILINSLLVFSLIFIYKTNEDFPYYHLPFTKYLIENKIIFGMGNIEHGYNYVSSLFFLNSTFYLPLIKFYAYHFSTLYYLIFFNFFLLAEIFSKKNNYIINFLYLFTFTFFNISFNRIAEYGTDKIGHLLIVIVTIKLIDILCFSRKINKSEKIILLIPLLGLCISLKTYFLPYILLSIPILFCDRNIFNNIKNLLFSRSFIFFFFLLTIIFFHHFVSTGCIISPIPITCFGDQFLWARSVEEIINLSNWLEQWSKAGAGPNFRVENPLEYISYFNWVPNWFEKYFLVKVLDQVAILITSYVLLILIFKQFKFSKKKIWFNKKNFIFIYVVLLIIFLIWFNKHPALRYGGYPICFLVISIPLSFYFSHLTDKSKIFLKLKYFVIFVFILINLKNMIRIYDEFFKNKDFVSNIFPFYSIEYPIYKTKKFDENFIMYATTKRFCWTIPSPCGTFDNIDVVKKNSYYFLNKKNNN